MSGNNPKDVMLHDHLRNGIDSSATGSKRALNVTGGYTSDDDLAADPEGVVLVGGVDTSGSPNKIYPVVVDSDGILNIKMVEFQPNVFSADFPISDGGNVISVDDAGGSLSVDPSGAGYWDDRSVLAIDSAVASIGYVSMAGGEDGNGDAQTLRLDNSTLGLQTVGYEHHEIHSGSHYFVGGYQDLAINNVLDFTWLMPNTTKWIHFTWNLTSENELNWLVYEGATATNPLANTITPVNNNRNSSNTSGTTMKYEIHATLAAANTDTDVSGATLIDSGISGSGRSSGNSKRDNEIIMKQNTLYCFRAIATAAGYVNFNMQWYEHTDKVT